MFWLSYGAKILNKVEKNVILYILRIIFIIYILTITPFEQCHWMNRNNLEIGESFHCFSYSGVNLYFFINIWPIFGCFYLNHYFIYFFSNIYSIFRDLFYVRFLLTVFFRVFKMKLYWIVFPSILLLTSRFFNSSFRAFGFSYRILF